MWWVIERNGKGVVVGPQPNAPTGVTLFSPLPYPTKALAQAAAGGVSTLPVKAKQVAAGISSSVLGPLFQASIWIRVGEVLAGLILLGIGLNAMLKGKPLSIVTKTAGIAAKAVPV